MGLFDPDPSGNAALVQKLLDLVKSPTAKFMGGSLLRAAPMAGQPFTVKPPHLGNISRPPSNRNTGGGGGDQGIGAAFGAGIASLFQGGQNPVAQDPLVSLYEQLIGQLQAPVAMPQEVDKEDLMRQIQKALNPIYDQRIDQAEGTYDKGSADITQMYRALANDYKEMVPEAKAQAQEAQQDVSELYGQLRSNIEGSYSRISDEQAAEFKQLGIEDALPDVLAGQNEAVQEAATAASELEATNAQRYLDQSNIDQTYYREGIPISTMTGNQLNADLLSQLQNYTQQTNAERSSGIQSAYMDQLGQAQSLLAQQQQTAQGEAARRQEMLWQILQGQMQMQAQQAKGMQGQELTVDSYIAGLPPQTQQQVASAFTRLQRSPEAIYGKVEDKRNPVPGTFVETTPEWYLAQADQMLRRGEIDESTYQALQMYMQLYFQLGR